MAERRAIVVGGGLAARAAALMLAGRGWEVELCGDEQPTPWSPHFTSEAGLRVLRAELPGLEEELLAAGARRHSVAMSLEHDFGPGAPTSADHAIALLCCRGSLLFDALRRRLDACPAVTPRPGPVTGLLREGLRVTGVRTLDGELRADAVIDAAGVSTPRRELLAAAGLPADRVTAWGPAYAALTRFYRHDERAPLPFRLVAHGPARGGLLPLDRSWFAMNFIMPQHRLPARSEEAERLFETLVDSVPGARPLMSRPAAFPLRTASGLRSAESDFYRPGSPAAALTGLYPLGDSLWVGNPIYARGFALSLLQASALVRSLDAPTHRDALGAHRSALAPLRAYWRAGAFNELADAPPLSSPGALLARAARGYFTAVLKPRLRRDPDLLRRFVLMYHLALPPHRVATPRQHLEALLLR